ncbi:MAG: hypothetical protein AB7T27_12695, partial [Kiritimatiellia bacterium]
GLESDRARTTDQKDMKKTSNMRFMPAKYGQNPCQQNLNRTVVVFCIHLTPRADRTSLPENACFAVPCLVRPSVPARHAAGGTAGILRKKEGV